MRRIGLLALVLITAVIIGLRHQAAGGSPAARGAAVPGPVERASRALTLLDVWSQLLASTFLLQQAQAHALRADDVATATLLTVRVRSGLLQVAGFEAAAAKDGALRKSDPSDARALRAVAAAWHDWAFALLGQPDFIDDRPRQIARLEARAMRLHDVAYAAIDASFASAVKNR